MSPSSSPVPTPKRIVGHAEVGDALEHGAGGGQGEAGVLVGRERPRPAVEELHRLGPGRDLVAQRGHRHGGQPLRQLRPQFRSPCISAFTLAKVRDGPPSTM